MIPFPKVAIVLGVIVALLEQCFIVWYFVSYTISPEDTPIFCNDILIEVDDSIVIDNNRTEYNLTLINGVDYIMREDESILPEAMNIHNSESYYLFVLINTKPENSAIRDAMRKTWLKSSLNSSQKIGYLFFMGGLDIQKNLTTLISQEQKNFTDIVMLDKFDNSFSSNTQKVLGMMVWASSKIKSQFFLKVENGVYAILERIFEVINVSQFPKEYVVLGNFVWKRSVDKEADDEPNWYLCNANYLPYPLAEGYIISEDVLQFLAEYADILQIYNHDDISLGVWTIGIDIHRIDDKRFFPTREQCSILSFIFYFTETDSLENFHYIWTEKKEIQC